MFTAAARISLASALRSSSLSEQRRLRSITGISSGVQSRGGVLRTSRKTGPYAVRSSSLVVDGGVVCVDVITFKTGSVRGREGKLSGQVVR